MGLDMSSTGGTEMTLEDRPYFASDCGDKGVQLQRNDELALYETDEEAIRACIADAAKGDAYAIVQLAKACNDPLLNKILEELQ